MNRLSILSRILEYPRYFKVLIMIIADYLSLLSSLVLTILFANKSFFFFDLIEIIGLFSIPLVTLSVFMLLRVYKSMVRFINFNGLITICAGIFLSTANSNDVSLSLSRNAIFYSYNFTSDFIGHTYLFRLFFCFDFRI